MSIVLTSRSGPDSKLHLEIPVGEPGAEFEVEIVIRPRTLARREWPPGYRALFNSIADETFNVHPQPPMPQPVELE